MTEGPISSPGQERSATDILEAADLLRPALREPDQAEPLAKRLVGAFFYRGPMPPPAMMAEYDRVVPGSAAAIIAMAQTEQKHRHRMQSRETAYPFLSMAAGISGLVICVSAATVLALYDNTVIAGMLLGCQC